MLYYVHMLRPLGQWNNLLCDEFSKDYYVKLEQLVENEYRTHCVYPAYELIFNALNTLPLENIKAVIIGQDPYHGEGQANGIAFAVNNGVSLPPSLVNIYKEIERDLGIKMPPDGSLLGWVKQGVLLLNTCLTVRQAAPQSHSEYGWQVFTDAVIKKCNDSPNPIAFMLWGSNAIKKKALISGKHLVLTAPHPSPLSAYRGFIGCGHFSRVNEFLINNGRTPINFSDVDGIEDKDYYKFSSSIKRV